MAHHSTPTHDLPDSPVRIYEVGPRDGLQNESQIVSVAHKVELIHRLVDAGATDVEIGSFVHPDWVPQMAQTDEVARTITREEGVRYWGLTPNARGLTRAIDSSIDHVAFFISASDTHNKKNLNRGVEDSLESLSEMFETARTHAMTVRAYISMVFGCPYEGEISFDHVLSIGERLLEMGADSLSLGDTIGIGTPTQVRAQCTRAIAAFGAPRLALHLHDTRGLGLTNAMVAHEVGMRAFDSSVGGIGGCPYAPGAAGNLGTEDLLYLLEGMGVEAPMQSAELSSIAQWLGEVASISIPSRCTTYLTAQRHDL